MRDSFGYFEIACIHPPPSYCGLLQESEVRVVVAELGGFLCRGIASFVYILRYLGSGGEVEERKRFFDVHITLAFCLVLRVYYVM